MWFMQKIHESEGDPANEYTEYKFLVDVEYFVGRNQGNIILDDDATISRMHAEIFFIGEGVPIRLGVRDYSKFGTFINGVRCVKRSNHEIFVGDVVQFGEFENFWRFGYRPVKCCTSSLTAENKELVQMLVDRFPGEVLPQWTENCSFLVMETLSVTLKMISALLSLRRIVTPKYLQDLVHAAKLQEEVPDPALYLPSLEANQFLDSTVDFAPNGKRTSLFNGTTFVSFSPRQIKKLNSVIKLAGASVRSEKTSITSLNESIVEDNVCVLQPPMQSVSVEFESQLANYLKTRGRRLIPDAEIGFAVLHCSCSKYCNPKISDGKEINESLAASSMCDTQVITQVICGDEQATEAETNRPTEVMDELKSPDLLPSTSGVKRPASYRSESVDMFKSVTGGKEFPTSSCDVYITKGAESASNVTLEEMDVVARGDDKDKIIEKEKCKNQTTLGGNGKSGGGGESSLFGYVRYTSLVKRRRPSESQVPTSSNTEDGHVRNFKSFRKVLPINSGEQPRPRLQMVERVTQSQAPTQSSNNDDDQDDHVDTTDSAQLFDWP